MKNIILITALLVSSFLCSASSYELFNENSKMLFTNLPERDLSFSIRFDSVTFSGEDTYFFNFKHVSSEAIITDQCEPYFWQEYCQPQDRPSWLGPFVKKTAGNIYEFMNSSGMVLQFDLSIEQGESMVFFEDADQIFSILFETTDTLNHLGIVDSIRFYRIAHTTVSGTPIESPLHNHQIMIGKELGLISFFKVDVFPEELFPLELIGNNQPQVGLTALTHEIVYDHQPGDIIQWIYIRNTNDPDLNTRKYTRHTYLTRTNLTDSIIYHVALYRYNEITNWSEYDTIYLKYQKAKKIAEVPFEWTGPSQIMFENSLVKTSYCDLQLWTYRIEKIHQTYCPEDNCWGFTSAHGTSFQYEREIVAGLGLYHEYVENYPPDWYFDRTIQQLVYFKKDGIECGEMVGLKKPEARETQKLTIYPNPTKDFLSLDTRISATDQLLVVGVDGRTYSSVQFVEGNNRLDVQSLPSGIYLLRILSHDRESSAKFVKY